MMNLAKTSALVLVFMIGVPVRAQETARVQASSRNIEQLLGIPAADRGKCGTSAVALAFSQWGQLSTETKRAISSALQRPSLDTSRLSPSGRFRIHYDTAGFNSPALISAAQRVPGSHEQFVDSVAYYFDRVWKLEIDTMGYLAPPSDGGQGGGTEYDIYIQELGTDTFGQTSWNESGDLVEGGNRRRFSTYIEIDNDFAGYRTPGMDGLRVTAAHEFYHAIQVGSYGVWYNVPNFDFYFYEITSVWMEHVAFPSIRDYYYYLPKYFERFRDDQDRSLSFTKYDATYRGYERAIWAIFLAKRFGRDVMKAIWTGMKLAPALSSMSSAIAQRGSTLEAEYALFSTWSFFTADRADSQRYFDDGEAYPRYKPNRRMDFAGMTADIATAAVPLSTQLYEFAFPHDTITAVVANVDVAAATLVPTTMTDLGLHVSSSDRRPPYQMVARDVGVSFLVSDNSHWRVSYLLASTRGNAVATPYASPNPLRLNVDSKLLLPLDGNPSDRADVYLLSGALEQVFIRQYDVRQVLGRTYIEIPVADLKGRVSSGIYYVVAKCSDQESTWKIAIIR